MSETFAYDIFISHSSKDRAAVRKLAERLKKDGLRVWFDEWEIRPGDIIGLKIEKGLEQSRILVLVMSRNAFASEWVTLQRHTALFRDPTNVQRRFIPLRLDDTEIRDTLKQFAYIDWQGETNEQYQQLLSVCRPTMATTASAGERQQQSPAVQGFPWHNADVYCVAISSDGRLAFCGTVDAVWVFDLHTRESPIPLVGHNATVIKVAVTADGKWAVSASEDRTVRVWDVEARQCLTTLEGHRHTDGMLCLAVTEDGRRVISTFLGRVQIWDVETGRDLLTLQADGVCSLVVTADGRRVVSGSGDGMIQVWDVETGRCVTTFGTNTGAVLSLAVTVDGQRVISGSWDGAVRVWDGEAGHCLATLEGHTRAVQSVAVTADGRRVVSASEDQMVRGWDVETGQCLAALEGYEGVTLSVAVTADRWRAVSGSRNGMVRVLDLPPIAGELEYVGEATRYTNAKVLLVGDSGVGKSGLAYRLTEDRFVSTISTDAAWATQLKLPDDPSGNDIEREIWLWDFAGQADYRLIHQLYMDEAALAILVFNPQSEKPFEGLGQWDRDLTHAARRPFQKLLVAGRCDRGGLMVSRDRIKDFCQERGFTDFLETSAYTGAGCPELREAIVQYIPWQDIPWTSSPHIFKRLKDEIIRLKDEGKTLLRLAELKQQLDLRLPEDHFTLSELRAVVGLLVGPGVVWQLEFGDFVLLQPERINAYAAAVIRSVRAHTEEIGCILEERVLVGDLDYQDMRRLPRHEEQIVLRAMHQILVDHGLCLREPTDQGTLLVLPSYFIRERPELDDHPASIVSYRFSGALNEIYATLVVRLHHTLAFDKDQLWNFAADFKTPAGKRIGLKMTKRGEGAAELTVYFEQGVPDDVKVTFIRYVHEHLQLKAANVERLRHYVCLHCHTPVENRKTALERLKRGQKDIVCVNCEKRVPLWDLIEEKFAAPEFRRRVSRLEEQSRASIDNESRELILVGHAFAIAGEAGQIFRPTPNSDWGIDGEIEFKDYSGNASGTRLYLQLKSGDSYLYTRQHDGAEIFTIRNERHAAYWQQQAYPVMLVIRTSDGTIRWMNITEYLQKQQSRKVKQIIFEGEPFSALNLLRLRDRVLGVS